MRERPNNPDAADLVMRLDRTQLESRQGGFG
jgi:hypothetical protein